MATPPRRCQLQQDEDDKHVMKVTVVSCKGERPSESVINVHIDGINPNANSPQIDKFMRRLTKNVVKIQNEIESQNNPHQKQTNSANESQTDSDLRDIDIIERKGKNQPTATNACEREKVMSPANHQQNKAYPTKEFVQNKLRNETRPQVKSNAPAKFTTANTDIVEIYSNKLITQSCDSVMNEWVKNDSSDETPSPTQQPIRRKRSVSCNNIMAQRGPVHVYQVNLPGTSLQKDNDGDGQEDTETDDISLSTVSFGNKSVCSCCHHHLSALDSLEADRLPFENRSYNTIVLSGKSSNSSAFNCCGAPKKTRAKTTTKTTTTSSNRKGVRKSDKNNSSSDGASTVTDASHDSESGNAVEKTATAKRRDSPTEKEILEKQIALLSEKAKNEELSKKTEEQNKRINELNKKLDELFRSNEELNRARAEDMRRIEEERWRMEDERQKELEKKQAEDAKRLEKNYPGDGKNRRVRTITKGNRTNIEAIEVLFHNKLPKQADKHSPQGANANRDSVPQRNQRLDSPASRGSRVKEDRLPPSEEFYSNRDREQVRPSGYPSYNPCRDFSDRSRGPENFENQARKQDCDCSSEFSDRSRGQGNLETQARRQEYDPSLNFSDRSRGLENLENQARKQDFCPNSHFPKDERHGYPDNRPPQTSSPVRACERCRGRDQDVTFCCCFKKGTKPNSSSRPTSPQRPCQCCGQCPPRCICEKGDVAPVSLYQNVASLLDMPAQINDAIYPTRESKSTEKTSLEGEPEISPEINASTTVNDVQQMGDGQPSISKERLEKSECLGNSPIGISRADLDKAMNNASSVDEKAALQMLNHEFYGQEGGQISPESAQTNIDPQLENEKKEKFVQKVLDSDYDDSAQIGDGIHPTRELKSKENMPLAGGVAEVNDSVTNGLKQPGPAKPKKRGNVFKYLCSCCNCTDSQQSIKNAEGVLSCTPGECVENTKSLGNLSKGISRAGLVKSKSKASNVGEKSALEMHSCKCNGQEGGQTGAEGVKPNVDPQFDNEKKEIFVQQKLGCGCEGQNNTQTLQAKFADETKKEKLIKKMMSCACEDSKIEDFPSEELISSENYDEQYFDDVMGIAMGRHGGYHVDQKARVGVQHNHASDGAKPRKDFEGKRNLVERRLDRHGFGQRHDCDKKRSIVQTRMGCVCNAEETGETLKKQRILEDRLECSCRPVGDPRKMREYVCSGFGCGVKCDEHVVRETRRKQAIVERRLHCSANHLRDTDKKSAYLKRRLDCICDDAGTQAKKQQAYLERFLACGCTNVARDMEKKKQFVNDFLKCTCDKESEVKKMQLYLERCLSCDCEHIKERNMDKKIDYMNKVMSCDGPSCKAEKEGKELVTVCGDGKASVAEVSMRLPPNPRALSSNALGSDALLCSCGSGESFLGPCRCDSMTDMEKSSARRHRGGATSSVAGGLICRCGKEGDSECICDGVKERPAKPTTKSSKTKCVCRHRLDGICRCRGKAGRNAGPKSIRSYLIDQVPCKIATSATAKSVSDSILCSAKKGNCNCELDPESCFCSEGSAKSEAEIKKGSASEEERRMSESAEEKSVQGEEDESESSPEENQNEIDQIEESTEVEPVEETVNADGCVCKKNCSGKCKCDIDGSDCSQGKQAKRCYCDAEGPETCICAKSAGRQQTISAQGKCLCTKDEAGRCKCDLTNRGQQRSRSRNEVSDTCHCRKDASGQCKCDKIDDKRSHKPSAEHSGVVIEVKNSHSQPQVSISGSEARKGNLKVVSSSTGEDGKEPNSQQHHTNSETQVHFVESHHSDLFVLKEPHFAEFSSESCPESNDEMANGSEFESPLNTSESGYAFESPLNTSASDQEYNSFPNMPPTCNEIQLTPSTSTRLSNDFEYPRNKSESSTYSIRESSELPQVPQEPAVLSVESHGTQSGLSVTEMKTLRAGPSMMELQSVQVGPPTTEVLTTCVRPATAGPSKILGEGRRPKWYHMFQMSNIKSHKRRKRDSEDSSGQSAVFDDCSQ